MSKNEISKADSRRGRHAEGGTAAIGTHCDVEAALDRPRPLGCTLGVPRPLEAVRVVAWKLNLMPLLDGAEVLSRMSDEERTAAGLNPVAVPCWVVAAVDCRTRAVLGMELAHSLETSTAVSCLQMITRDKGAICNGAGVSGHWSQHGIPERIVVDSGALFASSAFVGACHDLGMAVERTFAGMHATHDVIEWRLQTTFNNILSAVSRTSAFLILQSALAPRAPDYLRDALVRRDREFREQLDRLLQVDANGCQLPEPVRFTRGLETRGIAMIDGPGGGKTTTIARTLRKSTALNPPDDPR
jgi:transposase InsO family protein